MSLDRAIERARRELESWEREYEAYGTRGTMIRKHDIEIEGR